jgi:hypothetical protein
MPESALNVLRYCEERRMTTASGEASQQASVKTESDIMAEIAKLDLARELQHTHYNSLWEEQKHFTWLISIILSAQAIVLAGTSLDSTGKQMIISVASLVGILISITGYRAQRLESIYFRQANQLFVRLYNSVYPDAPTSYNLLNTNKPLPRLIKATLTGRAGIRDQFQFLFLAFTVIFIAIAAYSYVAL